MFLQYLYFSIRRWNKLNTSRIKINEYKADPAKAIEQLESCEYECQGGVLVNNVAFIALKELVTEGDGG